MQTLVRFPGARQVRLMRDGTFPPATLLPKALDDREETPESNSCSPWLPMAGANSPRAGRPATSKPLVGFLQGTPAVRSCAAK